jgi:hypothetical protein
MAENTNRDGFLLGAEAIADFLTEMLCQPVSASRVYHWHRERLIPSAKFGDHVLVAKDALRQHFARLAQRRATIEGD